MTGRPIEGLQNQRFRWSGIGLLVLLLSIIGLGLVMVRQWLELHQSDRFLSASLLARSTADYNGSWPTAQVAQVDPGIIDDIIQDSLPDPEDLPQRLASANAMLLTPVPTATSLLSLTRTQSITRVPATEKSLPTLTEARATSANATQTSLPTIPPTAPATQTSASTNQPTAPGPTRNPTSTDVPSSTPKPTNTPIPPEPTDPPEPTNTRKPTKTKKPTKTPKPLVSVNEFHLTETAHEKTGKQIQIGNLDFISSKTLEPSSQISQNITDSPRNPFQSSLFLPESWVVGLVWAAVLFLLITSARWLLNFQRG